MAAARGARLASHLSTWAVIPAAREANAGSSVCVLSRRMCSAREASSGESTFWRRVVNWAETVEGNTVMEQKRAIAECRARGRMMDFPICWIVVSLVTTLKVTVFYLFIENRLTE